MLARFKVDEKQRPVKKKGLKLYLLFKGLIRTIKTVATFVIR